VKRTKQIPNYRTVTETVIVTKTYDDGRAPRVQNTEVAGVGAQSQRTFQEPDGTYRDEEYWDTETYTEYENVEVPSEETYYETKNSQCHCYECRCPKCKLEYSHLNSLKNCLSGIFGLSWIFLKFSCIIAPFLLFGAVGILFGIYSKNWYMGYYISGAATIIGYTVGVISVGCLMTVLYCKKNRSCCFY
jgi:hypothetical protein